MHLGTDHATEVPDRAARRRPSASGDLAALLVDVAPPARRSRRMTAQGALGGYLGAADGAVNVQGETQKQLDVLANEACSARCEWGGQRGRHGVGRDWTQPYPMPADYAARHRYLLVFDPLDGSSNIDVNVSVGTHLLDPARTAPSPDAPTRRDFLQPGRAQVAAGYAIYGPATMLVLTVGTGHARLHARSRDRQLHR